MLPICHCLHDQSLKILCGIHQILFLQNELKLEAVIRNVWRVPLTPLIKNYQAYLILSWCDTETSFLMKFPKIPLILYKIIVYAPSNHTRNCVSTVLARGTHKISNGILCFSGSLQFTFNTNNIVINLIYFIFSTVFVCFNI